MAGIEWGVLGVIITGMAAIVGHMILRPKIMAEARNAEAEAQDRDWSRFQREIDRLDKKIADLEGEIEAKNGREKELRSQVHHLRNENMKLRKRVEGLEAVFKVGPIPPEMQELLDKLGEFE